MHTEVTERVHVAVLVGKPPVGRAFAWSLISVSIKALAVVVVSARPVHEPETEVVAVPVVLRVAINSTAVPLYVETPAAIVMEVLAVLAVVAAVDGGGNG
jgi:hypothetical protein